MNQEIELTLKKAQITFKKYLNRKNILMVIIAISLFFILAYVAESIISKIQSGEITLKSIMVTGIVLGVLAFFYFSDNKNIKAKFFTIVFSLVIFLAGSYVGALMSKVAFTNYGVLNPEEKYQFFVDMLMVLLTFTAIVWYLLHREIEDELKKGIEEENKQNRRFTETQTFKNTGYMHFNLYDVYSDCKGTKENKVAVTHLKIAIEATARALYISKELEEEKNEKVICIIKNNLAWFLKEKWECIKKRKEEKGGEDKKKGEAIFKEYLKEKNREYKRDKQNSLNYIDYIMDEKRTSLYTPEEHKGIIETHDEVKSLFFEIDKLLK